MNLLVGEAFSPWTIKARWALDRCGVAYAYREYTPGLSEPWLRWKLGRWRQPVSVPVMLTPGRALLGSWEIAQYAGQQAGEECLGAFDQIQPWDQISEHGLAAARTRVVRAVLADDRTLDEAVPFLPAGARFLLRPVARNVAGRLDRKYAALAFADAHRDALLAVRSALAQSGTGFVLDRFSYADISLSVLLEAVVPQSGPAVLGPAHRACWHHAALAAEFADLLEWRAGLQRDYGP
ncbi:glutathione S-transferase N-terminal domain-containing protein [Lysobacter silvisoli]|uniref:Glutathione S-transferase domain-containing protein n=1 Tax=Lysobacter silvisoli TaxID=2293254 RepID=A0A371JYG5_9GAMM|nr:glutathione S-transferase N-terminal domain-containing protein [Lysobacter silvisoli]RDZ26706.1 glutathione S-transferase domain-containing protein [Lysobacter silvisoli]